MFQPFYQFRDLNSMEHFAWVLSLLSECGPRPNFAVLKPCLKPLCSLLKSKGVDMIVHSCKALGYLCQVGLRPDFSLEPIYQLLLKHGDTRVLTTACRTLVNICLRSNDKIQPVKSFVVDARLVELLGHPPPEFS